MVTDLALVLAQGGYQPPSSPVSPPSEALTSFAQVIGYLKWGATAVTIAAVLALGALLTVDNRQVDQYGPSIQAVVIKVVLGCLIVAAAGHIADVFI